MFPLVWPSVGRVALVIGLIKIGQYFSLVNVSLSEAVISFRAASSFLLRSRIRKC